MSDMEVLPSECPRTPRPTPWTFPEGFGRTDLRTRTLPLPVQDGPSGCTLPLVDVKTQVLLQYILLLKHISQFDVNIAYSLMDHPVVRTGR